MRDILILGSGGWIPTQKRETCSYIYRNNSTLIILDAGTGISNLVNNPNLISAYSTINIILSHYHVDHIIGIAYLLNWINNDQKIVFWAPGLSLYKESSKSIISSFIGPPYFSRPIEKFSKNIIFNDYNLDGFLIDGLVIKIHPQIHSNPSYGIQIENDLYYATDTSVTKKTFELSQNCKLLLHECWELHKSTESSKHSSLQEILYYSSKYNHKSIGLIHINPNWTKNEEKLALKMASDRKSIFIAQDNQILHLD